MFFYKFFFFAIKKGLIRKLLVKKIWCFSFSFMLDKLLIMIIDQQKLVRLRDLVKLRVLFVVVFFKATSKTPKLVNSFRAQMETNNCLFIVLWLASCW